LVKEGLSRLKGEREQFEGKLKELEAAKAPLDVVRENAAKFITGWTDIGQLLDNADLAEQRVILQHLVHSLELTAADKAPSMALTPCGCSQRSGQSTWSWLEMTATQAPTALERDPEIRLG